MSILREMIGFETGCTKTIADNGGNWVIVSDIKNHFYAMAKTNECKDSVYGDIGYMVGLIYNYASFKPSDFTPYGLRMLHHELKRRGYKLKELFSSAGRKLAKNY